MHLIYPARSRSPYPRELERAQVVCRAADSEVGLGAQDGSGPAQTGAAVDERPAARRPRRPILVT